MTAIEIDKRCITETTQSNLKFEENKSKIVFINSSREKVACIQVDGCAIQSGVRCDNMLIVPSGIEYYIELKGGDVNHAIEQLETTIKLLSKDALSLQKFAFIVATKYPAIDIKIQKAKKFFKKKYNTDLIVKNTPASHLL